MRSVRLAVVAAALTLAIAAGANAAELRIGVGVEATTMDPHFFNYTSNVEINSHIFDYLVRYDAGARLLPGLARSWKAIDDTTWELALRRDVRFHDGTPFTARDVVFTFERARKVPNSPVSYERFLHRIASVVVVDDHTVRLRTDGPHPLLLADLTNVAIVSHKTGLGKTTDDYNAGRALNGTGPYRFQEWVKGDRIVLVRNDGYWGGAPHWDRVVFKPITSAPARTAALLSGDVDVINDVSPNDIPRFASDSRFSLFTTGGNRLLYLGMDVARDQSPFVRDAAGGPMSRNPLKDVRVRRAISKAINRAALVERVMGGQAMAAGQFLPRGFFGVSPALEPEPFDPAGARALLAEAGYPSGFRLTIHGPNDRYLNDEKVLQAVAQMLSRAGIPTEVGAMSRTIYFTRLGSLEFSVFLVGTSTDTGEASDMMKFILATYDKAKGMGAGNRGRFSSPEYDRLLEAALVTVDDARRERLLQQAAEIGIGREVGIVPLYYTVSTWAARKGLTLTPRFDQMTLASEVAPAS